MEREAGIRAAAAESIKRGDDPWGSEAESAALVGESRREVRPVVEGECSSGSGRHESDKGESHRRWLRKER